MSHAFQAFLKTKKISNSNITFPTDMKKFHLVEKRIPSLRGMGTKIQANPFLREYHSVIDLDASTSNAMRSSYNETGMLQNGTNPDSISTYDIQKVKQTILEHESVFRNQLGELHRLYGRQRELMAEIKRRGMNKTDVMEEKLRSSYLLSPFPTENTKRSWNPSGNNIFRGGTYNLGFQERFPKFPVVQSTPEKRSHLAACDGDNRLHLLGIQTSQHGADALPFSLCNRNGYPGDERMTNPRNGVSDRLALSRPEMSGNPCSNLNLVTKDFFHDSRDGMSKEGSLSIRGLRNERSGPDYYAVNSPEKWRIGKRSSLGELGSGKSVAFAHSLLAEPRKEYSNSASLSRKKKKIFGVEISEGNDDAFDYVPNTSSGENHRVPTSLIADSFVQNLSLHGAYRNEGNDERSKAESKGGTWLQKASVAAEGEQKAREAIPQRPILADCERSQDNNPKGSLPWFLRDSKVSTGLNDRANGCYFMNLDSLQSRSHTFFAKVEKPDGTLQISNPKKEVKGQDLRHCIDLNMSLDEEGAPSAPSLPCAIVKIAMTEIDLEAPASLESEVEALDSSERDKVAAEAMIAISSSVEEKPVDRSFTCLKWFAQLVSSEHVATNQRRAGEVEEPVPDGMDHFEFMTLKLEDSKEEYHHYEPLVLKAPSDDDTGASLTRRTRRGQARRGRQRRDFQRDILPGLVALSRLQVTEDFQAFDELLKAGGATRQSHSMRNGRGRKRLASSPRAKTPCSRQAEQPVCQIEERSLAGWGKKTRRLPRQRCPNAFLSLPVKYISILKKLHACVITHGLERNIFLGSKLFNLLAKFNLLAESKWVFNSIINNNLSLWNSIVVGYFRAEHYTEVLGIYLKLRRKRIGTHSSAITFALKSCGELGASKFGRNLHADAVRIGLSSDRFVGSSLIEFYTKCDRIGEAAKVFDEIAERDVVAYTSLITAYCKAGDHRANEAFRVAAEMQINGFEPNRVTLVSLLHCASQLRALSEGRSIHGYAVRRGVGLGCADEVFETSLIDTYVKCGDPNAGAIVFDKMSRKTTGSRNALMAGYLKLGEPLEAFAVFVEMVGESELDLIALANGLLSCADSGYLLIGKAIHCHIIREGVVLDLVGETALIDMYSKCKNLSAAMNVFYRSEAKDAAMLNVMISGYLHNGCVYRAIETFRGMFAMRVKPNTGTIISVLSALSNMEDVRTGRCIHGFAFRQGLEAITDIANQFINMYAKCGLMGCAGRVFDRIKIKDRVSWTSMMTGLVSHGRADAAMALFLLMQRENLQLDAITYTCLVQALNHLGSLMRVREVHGRVYRESLERDTTLMNSLITTYSKQGKLKVGRSLFKLIDEKHLSSWNTMIAAYGMHGDFVQALKLFYRMRREKITLDGVTFKSILSACSHTGLIEEGFHIFSSMEWDYGITPSNEHYGCLVDLLCRAGKLEEAYDVLERAPSRRSASTLGSLLAACRVHGNSDIGERVGRLLLEIEPENPSAYCSLSNLYAGEGRWDEVADIGGLAKRKGLSRTPGYSLIDLN
ncbi:pentatricopeptide repeat-containing protein-like protein [Salvia divinorum]|uniref:Pentatricopeptide repeat-containing protein-like protein n=1 Tax=Salvia divinorum TaxID=28513 RepID=A0ABD1G3R6_SALDI